MPFKCPDHQRRYSWNVYAGWIARYPEATQYTRVSLRLQTPNIIPLAGTPAPTVSAGKAA